MSTWTAGELRERLDDYGDHVPVVLIAAKGETEKEITDFDVDDGHSHGLDTLAVKISVDL